MNLQNLLEHPQLASVVLQGLCEHTSEVQPDYGFVGIAEDDEALQAHCEHAVRQGAVALFMDSPEINWSQDIGVPVIQVPDLAKIRGELAAAFYADPSAQLTCVGVTGTNGKTSVAYHVADLGARLGMAMGYCGTLGWGNWENFCPAISPPRTRSHCKDNWRRYGIRAVPEWRLRSARMHWIKVAPRRWDSTTACLPI